MTSARCNSRKSRAASAHDALNSSPRSHKRPTGRFFMLGQGSPCPLSFEASHGPPAASGAALVFLFPAQGAAADNSQALIVPRRLRSHHWMSRRACAPFNPSCERSEPLVRGWGSFGSICPGGRGARPGASAPGLNHPVSAANHLLRRLQPARGYAGRGAPKARAEGRLRPVGAGRGLAP